MIFGHSQGGGAALFAAEQAATYAPELDVIGTVAGAPAGDLDTIAAAAPTIGAGGGFLLMAIAGFEAAYPDLPLDAVINTPEAVTAVADTCTSEAFALAGQAGLSFLNPLGDPQWNTVIDQNTAGHVEPSAPVLIVHGEADTTVPRALSDVTLKRYCALGATIELKSYPGADHVGVLTAAAADIVSFLNARLAGTPANSSCPAG
jgi:pimeloyl-ACP methyl ester carboxylesterase